MMTRFHVFDQKFPLSLLILADLFVSFPVSYSAVNVTISATFTHTAEVLWVKLRTGRGSIWLKLVFVFGEANSAT
jgi:hypothetical protein